MPRQWTILLLHTRLANTKKYITVFHGCNLKTILKTYILRLRWERAGNCQFVG